MMPTWIAWPVWFVLALPWFLLDGWLGARLAWGPDLTVVTMLMAGLHLRAPTVAGFVFCAATARALVLGGPTAVHFLALAAPVAVLVALRGVFVERSMLWQLVAATFVAWSLPLLVGVLGRLAPGNVAVEPLDAVGVARAVLWGPLLAAGLSRVPPWRAFGLSGTGRRPLP